LEIVFSIENYLNRYIIVSLQNPFYPYAHTNSKGEGLEMDFPNDSTMNGICIVAIIFLVPLLSGLSTSGWRLGKRRARHNDSDKGETTCIICRDESPDVCPYCPNKKVHDKLVAEMEAMGEVS
jgi:hypothetical protein